MKYNCKKIICSFCSCYDVCLGMSGDCSGSGRRGGWHTCCVRYFLVIDTASCGNRSGIDHKKRFTVPCFLNFSWSTSVLWR